MKKKVLQKCADKLLFLIGLIGLSTLMHDYQTEYIAIAVMFFFQILNLLS